MVLANWISTGFKGLDETINHLRLGDNVVWQIDDINDYKYFVGLFVQKAVEEKRNIVYIRFADHQPLVFSKSVKTINIDAKSGFESFSTQIHNIVKEEGIGAFYVFDCLSYLLEAWASDLMIGNFFMITCPYLFELDTVAYFALKRNNHSFKTIARIRETTQLLIDLYNIEGKFYVHPLKVWKRYSPTMFLPHQQQGASLVPILSSIDSAKLFSYISEKAPDATQRNLDYWDKLFLDAEETSRSGSLEKKWETINRICKLIIGREKRILVLARNCFSLDDLLGIKSRMIGTGFIGGKSVGMLLSRNILEKDDSLDWNNIFEPHDSFYIGSDVFYTFIVQNSLWKKRMEQKTREGYFSAAKDMKEKILNGVVPDDIKEQLMLLIDYFGQSPIIIRSSSLLEDSYGNAFAGKYESFFSVNQGSPQQRYQMLEEYIKRVYASTMDEDALTYRLQRGLDQQDEQMALLVQRVSGSYRKKYFFPDIAGVGISYNTFVWKEDMDPKSGMLRLVFGLGTRAVNRVEDDYPRTVALDDPFVTPNAGKEDEKKYSQRKVDTLNIETNAPEEMDISKLMVEKLDIDMEHIGELDIQTTKEMQEHGMKGQQAWKINFHKLFSNTDFVDTMKKMLKKLEAAYHYPVDIEFTANFTGQDKYKINLLQCRPLQTMGMGKRIKMPENLSNSVLFMSQGNFMGGNISQKIKKIIYIDPANYSALDIQKKYTVARLVGRFNKQVKNREEEPILMIGPGRWGTSTPSLGVPVNFSEINNVTVLVELDYLENNLTPDLSFGTHFFQDLVETNIFYVAIFPHRENTLFNKDLIKNFNNIFCELFPDDTAFENVIKVYDTAGKNLILSSDIVTQKVVCYLND